MHFTLKPRGIAKKKQTENNGCTLALNCKKKERKETPLGKVRNTVCSNSFMYPLKNKRSKVFCFFLSFFSSSPTSVKMKNTKKINEKHVKRANRELEIQINKLSSTGMHACTCQQSGKQWQTIDRIEKCPLQNDNRMQCWCCFFFLASFSVFLVLCLKWWRAREWVQYGEVSFVWHIALVCGHVPLQLVPAQASLASIQIY